MSGWDADSKRFGHYEDDEEPETVERVVRVGGKTLSSAEAETLCAQGVAPSVEPQSVLAEASFPGVGKPAPSDGSTDALLKHFAALTGPSALPARGSDPTGTVMVSVDRYHVPTRLDLRRPWQIGSVNGMLDVAIRDAYHNALEAQREEGPAYTSRSSPGSSFFLEEHGQDPCGSLGNGENYMARVLTLVEQVRDLQQEREADRLRRELSESSDDDMNAPDTFGVSLQGSYMVSCAVNPGWARQATASEIEEEFTRSVDLAREEQDALQDTGAWAQSKAMRLAKEGFALAQEGISRLRQRAENI